MDSAIALMNREWAVMTGPDGRPDSTKLYRGTGYSLALGTGTLGTRLEKAGVAGMISSRLKLSGFRIRSPRPVDAAVRVAVRVAADAVVAVVHR